jgi:hypothetical protein
MACLLSHFIKPEAYDKTKQEPPPHGVQCSARIARRTLGCTRRPTGSKKGSHGTYFSEDNKDHYRIIGHLFDYLVLYSPGI